MSVITIDALTWKEGADGQAHLSRANSITSLCGFMAWQAAGTEGIPCPACLETATRLLTEDS